MNSNFSNPPGSAEVIVPVSQIDLTSFFKLCYNPKLIDLTSEANFRDFTIQDFTNCPGSAIFEIRFALNENFANVLGVQKLVFEFSDAQGEIFPQATFSVDIPSVPNVTNSESKMFGNLEAKNYQKTIVYKNASGLLEIANAASSIVAVSDQQPIATSIFQQAVKSSELYDKKDPAQILSSGKLIGKTPNQSMNFGSKSSTKSKYFDRIGAKDLGYNVSITQIRDAIRKSRKIEKHSLFNDFFNLKKIEKSSDLTKTLPVAEVELLSSYADYTRHLVFDKSVLGVGRMTMTVKGVVKPDILSFVQPKSYTFTTQEEYNNFIVNPEPPDVVIVESAANYITFMLKQTDPTLSAVKVVRIIKNPNNTSPKIESVGLVNFETSTNTSYKNANGKLSKSENNGYQFYTDIVDNVVPNTIIYRFIVENSDGSYGNFTSVIAEPAVKVVNKKNSSFSSAPISIRAINTFDGISIAVDVIRDRVYSIRLLRQDLGGTGEISNNVKTILNEDGQYSTVVGKATTFEFLDTETITGRNYRYFIAYRLGTSSESSLCQETLSIEDESIVRFSPDNRLPYTAKITPASFTQDENNLAIVKLGVEAIEKEEIFNSLFDALKKGGIDSQVASDALKDRLKPKDVVMFLIERVDRTTGKRVSFGLYPPGEFEDSPAVRSKKNLPELISGRRYEYICKMCIRPTATILNETGISFVAEKDVAGVLTTVLAAKFQGALINRGILPSEKESKENSSISENIIRGQTGIELSATVDISIASVNISELLVFEEVHYNTISWSITGKVDNVSYFLVYCVYNSTPELLGVISAVGQSGYFAFKDTILYNEVGTKSYQVMAVDVDHNVISVSRYFDIIKEYSIPQEFLEGYMTYVNALTQQQEIQKVGEIPPPPLLPEISLPEIATSNEAFIEFLDEEVSMVDSSTDTLEFLKQNVYMMHGDKVQQYQIDAKNEQVESARK